MDKENKSEEAKNGQTQNGETKIKSIHQIIEQQYPKSDFLIRPLLINEAVNKSNLKEFVSKPQKYFRDLFKWM